MHSLTMPALSRGRHRATTALASAVALFALTLAMAFAPPASAIGAYVHYSCINGSDLSDAYGGWAAHAYGVVGNGNVQQCPTGGLHSEMFPGSAMPLGSTVGWKYTAPPNTTITHLSATLAGWTKPFDNQNQGLFRIDNGAGVNTWSWQGSRDPTNQLPVEVALNTNAIDMLLLCDGPNGNAPCQGSTGWASWYYPHITLSDDNPPIAGTTSGTLTTNPKLVGTESFNYAATDLGGGIAMLRIYLDGQQVISHIADNNNGHCQPIGSESGNWQFSYPKPCPGSINTTENITTTDLADGQHTITARIVDAGQREAVLWTGQRLIANHPPIIAAPPAYEVPTVAAKPIVGTELVGRQGAWSGPSLTYAIGWQRCDSQGANCAQIPGAFTLKYVPVPDDVGHRLRMSITATNAADSVTAYSDPTGLVTAPSSVEDPTAKPPTDPSPGAPGTPGAAGAPGTNGNTSAVTTPGLPSSNTTTSTTVLHTLVGRVAGERDGVACPDDKATLKFQHISGGELTLRYGKASTAQAELTCTNSGKAIVGAKLEIATKTGSHPAVASDMTTDGAGHATLRIAKGPSRGVSVGYRMYADDPIARATATLKVLVDAQLSVKANHKKVRNGQAVTLTGKLAGGEIPTRGVTLSVQWKDGKRWRPFASLKSTRKGAFRYAYRFTRTRRTVHYQLRVQVAKGQIDYAFQPVASKPLKVTVAP